MEKNDQEADERKSERMGLLFLEVFQFKMPFGTHVEISLILFELPFGCQVKVLRR